MKLQRAYSVFDVKGVDDEQRIIEGIATTPTPDRMGDIIEPKGAEFKLPMPLLWQHNAKQPIGHVISAKVTEAGIAIKAQLAKGVLPYIDEAWTLIKEGLVRGLSIGFRGIEQDDIKGTWSMRFIKWEWLELSAVTIPANAEATIQAIKSISDEQQAASLGHGSQPSGSPACAKASTPAVKLPATKAKETMKTIAEQIAALEAARQAKAARMNEIMQKAIEEGRSTDEAEREEFDTLKSEVKTVDDDLVRLRELEKMNISKATPASGGSSAAASQTRGGQPFVTVSRNLPKGTAFTRFAMALAQSKGNIMHAVELAKQWHDSTPEVELALKAAVTPGTTTDSGWAAPLVDQANMASEFIDLLRPATIIGRISGFRNVPFNVKMPRKTAGGSVGWVGQAKPKPVSELAFDTVSLGFSKISGIIVLTEELVRFSTPSAEAVVRQDMIDTISEFSDQQFIDPTVALVANVSPASVTNGVSAVTSTGATLSAIETDVKGVMDNMINANMNLANGTWVMHPRTALSLSMMRTTQDIKAFPEITPQGGTFFGLPVVTSQNVPVAGTSGDPTIIALVAANDILLADDGGVTLDASREASLQMDSAPVTGAQSLVSLWQNNLVGLRAERFINWQKRRAAAVQYISGVTY